MQAITVEISSPNGMERRIFSPMTESIVVGRDPNCDITLPDTSISRQHTIVRVTSDSIQVQDTSVNGTVVGGNLVIGESVTLCLADKIGIGSYALTVKRERPEASKEESTRAGGMALASAHLRRSISNRLVGHLDMVKLERSRLNPKLLRAKVDLALREITKEAAQLIPAETDVEALIKELTDEAVGLGPLESLLADDRITEIMVVDPTTIYIECGGEIERTALRFTDDTAIRTTIERIVAPLGRRIDESSPMIDARLADGSRVNAIIPPLATRGPCITIRKFSKKPLVMGNLLEFGTLSDRMALFLQRAVIARKNIVVAGGTGSGKTTLLNILSGAIPSSERIVTIEDSTELQLQQSHVVTLEARPPNLEGKGAISIRDLVKNAMRMRPDRVIVGECRGGEALDMLLVMNTGHDGSMTTTHANSPEEALRRLEALSLMSSVDLPARSIREQIACAIDLLVHQVRLSDGSRRITSITEVVGIDDGVVETREIFGYRERNSVGEFYATGNIPTFIDEFVAGGLIKEGEAYL